MIHPLFLIVGIERHRAASSGIERHRASQIGRAIRPLLPYFVLVPVLFLFLVLVLVVIRNP
jgi:hypothetical protein